MNCEDLPWQKRLQKHDSKFSEPGLVALCSMLFREESQTEGGRPLILTFSPDGGENLLALLGLDNESNKSREVFYGATIQLVVGFKITEATEFGRFLFERRSKVHKQRLSNTISNQLTLIFFNFVFALRLFLMCNVTVIKWGILIRDLAVDWSLKYFLLAGGGRRNAGLDCGA